MSHMAPESRPTYPDRRLVAEVYAEVARLAALGSNCTHPEDLACEAETAIDGARLAIEVLWEKGAFK